MRWYDIASGILLFLPTVDFALAAPVLVQEKQRQARVDVVHIPKDVITVFGKRTGDGMYDEIDRIIEKYFADFEIPSGEHSATSSSQPGPDRSGDAQNPGSLGEEPTSSAESSTTPLPPKGGLSIPIPEKDSNVNLAEKGSTSNAILDDAASYNGHDAWNWLQHSPMSPGIDWDRKLFFLDAHPPPQPNRPRPTIDSEGNPSFDWNYWMKGEDTPPPRPASATEPGHEVVAPPSTDPENQWLSTDSPPEGLQAIIYAAAKGKAKDSRHISGTARDVGNLAQRELQPAERSLDPGE
jgi:hypothetical protein